jgi:hypothetical protein
MRMTHPPVEVKFYRKIQRCARSPATRCLRAFEAHTATVSGYNQQAALGFPGAPNLLAVAASCAAAVPDRKRAGKTRPLISPRWSGGTGRRTRLKMSFKPLRTIPHHNTRERKSPVFMRLPSAWPLTQSRTNPHGNQKQTDTRTDTTSQSKVIVQPCR